MEEICKRFSNKIHVDINNLIFLYKGNYINKNLTFESMIDKAEKISNEMNILS